MQVFCLETPVWNLEARKSECQEVLKLLNEKFSDIHFMQYFYLFTKLHISHHNILGINSVVNNFFAVDTVRQFKDNTVKDDVNTKQMQCRLIKSETVKCLYPFGSYCKWESVHNEYRMKKINMQIQSEACFLPCFVEASEVKVTT